jgi:hypothetical protein
LVLILLATIWLFKLHIYHSELDLVQGRLVTAAVLTVIAGASAACGVHILVELFLEIDVERELLECTEVEREQTLALQVFGNDGCSVNIRASRLNRN